MYDELQQPLHSPLNSIGNVYYLKKKIVFFINVTIITMDTQIVSKNNIQSA
jgi:hypothetical protein